MTDEGRHHLLRWWPTGDGEHAIMELLRRQAGTMAVLAAREVPWRLGLWHQVAITVQPGQAAVTIDGGPEHRIPCSDIDAGGIGLWLTGQAEAEFDEVRVRTIEDGRTARGPFDAASAPSD